MARPLPKSIYKGHATKRPREDTMLSLWLKAHGISKDKAARLIGCSGKTIDLWCTGQMIPGLIYAIKIEQVTQGGVGMEMWAGTSLGKYQWNEIERRAVK